MCQQTVKIETYIDERNQGYMKGHGWYIAPSGSEKLRVWVRQNQGKTATIETVRGMLVKVVKVK